MPAASALPFSAATLRRVSSSATPLRAEARRGEDRAKYAHSRDQPERARGQRLHVQAGQMKISLVPKPALYDFGPRSLCVVENYAAAAVFNLNNPFPTPDPRFRRTTTRRAMSLGGGGEGRKGKTAGTPDVHTFNTF